MPTTTAPPRVHAKVIAHSAYPGGPDLVSVQATGRRFILSELNTHRALSKNSASSRAIPFPKQVQRILDNLALPEVWASEQKGMQGGDEIADIEGAEAVWQEASEYAIDAAQQLADLGVHKSIVNRLLEPFMWHTVILTGTAWENFFDQRCHPAAQPEIRVMAEAIRTAIQNSTPDILKQGDWHLPYVEQEDADAMVEKTRHMADRESVAWDMLRKISAARCARVSYLTQEGKRDIETDLELYSRLTDRQADSIHAHDPIHWSPLEHVATPWPENRGEGVVEYEWGTIDYSTRPKVGNLLMWRSLRTEVEAARGLVTYR